MGKRKRKNRDAFFDLAEKYRSTAVPRCQYFGVCGGCKFQDISYDNQLLIKKEFLNNLFEGVIDVNEVRPSLEYGYRNRMDFVAAFNKRGLRRAGSFKDVVDLEDCPLLQDRSREFWQKLREHIIEVEDYDYLIHEGFLRYTVIRQSYFNKELMCNFVVSRDDVLSQSLIDFACNNADSVSIILNDTLSDTSFGPVIKTIKGGYITESFDGVIFKVMPNSFFQSNSFTALEMYEEIKANCFGRVMDLYSGVGSISLFVSSGCDHVTGVEIIEEAVEAANENLALNEASNVDFVCRDARWFMKENKEAYDTLILDPPRAGIHPRMLKYINDFLPKRIIYMSCNPATFKDNLSLLEKYSLDSFKAYDMFPQTPHVETLAVMTLK